MLQLVAQIQERGSSEACSAQDGDGEAEGEAPAPKRSRFEDILLGDVECAPQETSLDEEVKAFTSVTVREADPLKWWAHNAPEFPRIASVARTLLCIPATEVASERIFSTTGNTVTKRRATLDPATVDKLIFINKNAPGAVPAGIEIEPEKAESDEEELEDGVTGIHCVTIEDGNE